MCQNKFAKDPDLKLITHRTRNGFLNFSVLKKDLQKPLRDWPPLTGAAHSWILAFKPIKNGSDPSIIHSFIRSDHQIESPGPQDRKTQIPQLPGTAPPHRAAQFHILALSGPRGSQTCCRGPITLVMRVYAGKSRKECAQKVFLK